MNESMKRQIEIAELELLADCHLSELICIFGRIKALRAEEDRAISELLASEALELEAKPLSAILEEMRP